MSLGACLVANDPLGIGEGMIQARVSGKSWSDIATEFNLPNPNAARKAFQKYTGISDFKVKGKALKQLVKDLADGAPKMGVVAEKTAVRVAKSGLNDAPKVIDEATLPKWKKSIDKIAEENGIPESAVRFILEEHKAGHGYSAIRTALNHKGYGTVDFSVLDRVVWDLLLEEAEGRVWKAYLMKPSSQTGYDAVRARINELLAKGLSPEDIAKLQSAPPLSVIQAIQDGTWKLAVPGAKTPVIPPPPPPPPQMWSGPVATGTNYRRYSEQEMMDWIQQDILEIGSRATVKSYTGTGYFHINSSLRARGPLSYDEAMKQGRQDMIINRLDQAMRPIPFDVLVTRHIDSAIDAFGVNDIGSLVGTVVVDKGFLSTSILEAGAFSSRPVQMIIKVPKGTMGRYVGDISSHYREKELLLARHLNLLIESAEKTTNAYGKVVWKVVLVVVP